MIRVILLAWALAIAALWSAGARPVYAHEIHGGHQRVNYTSWVNREGKNCCNSQDCRPAKDADVRLSPRVQVRIAGVWCPVTPEHYLRAGNAPDWQSNHVCVSGNTSLAPCERLLCFQPKPLF